MYETRKISPDIVSSIRIVLRDVQSTSKPRPFIGTGIDLAENREDLYQHPSFSAYRGKLMFLTMAGSNVTMEDFLATIAAEEGFDLQLRSNGYWLGSRELVGDHPKYVRRMYRVHNKDSFLLLRDLPETLNMGSTTVALNRDNGILTIIADRRSHHVFEQILAPFGITLMRELIPPEM